MTHRKKLIEVALPLEAINKASAREKSIRHGHPSTLHLWWARRPLAAARAVIFTSLVDDPDDPAAPPAFVEACRTLPIGPNATAHDTPRMRLFDFIERLVQWESTTDERILSQARELINLSTDGNPPPLLDPFAGGGAIPLEAQRLGLEAHASDLNPVAVMINKAMIEIPPRFAGMPPVNPEARNSILREGRSTTDRRPQSPPGGSGESGSTRNTSTYRGAAGLAADVRYYGQWMRDRAWERIGHLYPDYDGETVIAWLWARTVKSPNPAIDAWVPLVRSFELSKKKGKRAWVEPQVDPVTNEVTFEVRTGQGKAPDGTVGRNHGGGTCLVTGVPMSWDYIREQGQADQMRSQLMAIVTEGVNGRSYYAPNQAQQTTAGKAQPTWTPDFVLPTNPRDFKTPLYGMTTYADLFTPRQLVALTTFSDLVAEARAQAEQDALAAGLPADDAPLRDGGRGAKAYAEAVSVYLAFAVDKHADYNSTICSWHSGRDTVRNTFGRQAIPMVWDYTEVNPFSDSTGNWMSGMAWIERVLDGLQSPLVGIAFQMDAASSAAGSTPFVSTDPPYYDNIGYADLSDFFYVWLRRNLRTEFPSIFSTMLVPKAPEIIASPYRFNGSREMAMEHFEDGLQQAFVQLRMGNLYESYPMTVFYAFKQAERGDGGIASTGWETMLASLIDSGYSIVGTWPMRTEMSNRAVARGANALASSIVLVCRGRAPAAQAVSRREFINALRAELPTAIQEMQSGNIAPVDLAQASIGPGMAVYSRYAQVLEPDGSPLTVRTALQLINQELDAFLAEQEGDVDADTRFAVAWFEQFGFDEGDFGLADVLVRAKNTSVDGVVQAGVVASARGKVHLRHWDDADWYADWTPLDDTRATIWEATHHLIHRLQTRGESGAARLLIDLNPDDAAEARQLAYRLYSICERKGWADHALNYNALVISWPAIQEEVNRLRAERAAGEPTVQGELFE